MLKSKKLLALVCAFSAIFAVVGYTLQDGDAPVFTLTPETDRVSLGLPLTLHMEDTKPGLKSASVAVRLGNRVIPVLDTVFRQADPVRNLTFDLKSTALSDGPIELEITVTDASWRNFGRGNATTTVIPLTVDSIPPNIIVKTSPPNVRRGGSACIVYSVSKEVSQTGITVGDLFFPAFRQANGDYLCFFAFPYYMLGKDYHPMLAAVDRAGNVRKEAVDISRVHVDFRKDNINIDQAFLEKKSAEFTAMYPGEMSDFERFLKINGDVRKSNADKLLELGKDTSADILWNGAFLRLPRSASRADFADHRTYFFEGTRIDEQVHLGFDLASVVQAPVPAANAGRVIFSGYLGIYGNLVVIDHGLGLQSLYSHLTVAQVQKDQLVKKGEIIGATGATGMAGGDHLHFGILISGLEVSPQEWLDARWVKNNIADRVLAAGGVMPDVVEIPPASPPPAKQQPPARKRPRRR